MKSSSLLINTEGIIWCYGDCGYYLRLVGGEY